MISESVYINFGQKFRKVANSSIIEFNCICFSYLYFYRVSTFVIAPQCFVLFFYNDSTLPPPLPQPFLKSTSPPICLALSQPPINTTYLGKQWFKNTLTIIMKKIPS